jgi:rhamnosyltransferase
MTPESQMPNVRFDRADIAVAVVLYHPSDSDLDNVTELTTWGVNVVAVVNAISETQRRKLPSGPGVSVIVNSGNLGLARALNQAVGAAIDAGVHFVLMLDQDSRPTVDMLDRLASAAIAIQAEGRPLACVAPLLRDRKATVENGISSTDIAGGPTFATSGTMLTRQAWLTVGPMWSRCLSMASTMNGAFVRKPQGLKTSSSPKLSWLMTWERERSTSWAVFARYIARPSGIILSFGTRSGWRVNDIFRSGGD